MRALRARILLKCLQQKPTLGGPDPFHSDKMPDQSSGLACTIGSFVSGVVASAIVAVPIYRQQKKEARASEERLFHLLNGEKRRADWAYSTMRDIALQNSELLSRYDDLRDHLATASRTRSSDDVEKIAADYADVARALSNAKAQDISRTGAIPEQLTVSWLLDLHRNLFPSGFEFAGRLRTVRVWIGTSGGGMEAARFVPPPPHDVAPRLEALLSQWNRTLSKLRRDTRRDQAAALARFHHDFVSVHPFLDGNGVISRVTTALQAKLLTGKAAQVLRTDSAYYSALEGADAGDLVPLVELVERTMI